MRQWQPHPAPLAQLRSGIAALGRGEEPTPLPPRLVRDELGDLLGSFETMHAEVVRTQQAGRQLTDDIAHDLKTPLTVIRGQLEAMLDGTFQPTPARLSRLNDQAGRLARLVADLRLLAQAEAGELPLRARRPERDRRPRPTAAGAGQPAGQRAQPRSRLCGHAAGLGRGKRRDPQMQDAGPGVSPQELPHLFERLYRADPSRQTGSGLGLSISRGIVQAHGGCVAARSAPQEGLIVEVWLPDVA